MKIKNNSMKTDSLFNLDEGDIFLYNDHYYIAGEISFIDHRRECYDLSMNYVRIFTVNYEVISWNGNECELIIG